MSVTDEQIQHCAERESEIDKRVNRLARSAITYGGLGAAEKKTMSELLDERIQNRAALGVSDDDFDASNTRVTKPVQPGRRSGDSSTADFVGRRIERDLEDRGWSEWKPPKRQDLDNYNDGEFRDLAEMLRAIRSSAEGRFDRRLEPFVVEKRAGQTESVGSEGGFAVAPRFMAELLVSASHVAPFLDKRRIFQVRDTNSVNFPALKDQDRSSDEIAGLALSRVGEGVTLVEDQIIFRSVTLKLHKAAKLIPISNELMADSSLGMNSIVNDTFGRAVALLQTKDFFTGTGSGEPLGFANGNDLFDAASSTAAGSLLISDLSEMLARLEGSHGDDSVWLLHPSVFPALAQLRFSTSAGESPMFSPNASAAAPRSIYGLPYFFSDSAKVLNTIGDIVLCNMRAYLYAFSQIVIDVSLHHKFDSDETTFRLKMRDSGQPMRDAKLTDRQSYLQANFVRLATRT